MEEEILDIKRENYKLRKENFELIQDNVKLQEEYGCLVNKYHKKICMESQEQYQELKEDLKNVLNQVLLAFEKNACIDWEFKEIREKYNL